MRIGFYSGGMTMRALFAVIALCLLVLLTGTAWSSGDAPGSAASYGFGNVMSAPAGGCPELAYTESFRTRGLGYVYTEEFAAAVKAVASGSSTYSPQDIPAGWKAAADGWYAYVKAHPAGASESGSPAGPGSELFAGGEGCSPTLLYLASLHYRSKKGAQGVTPVFPRLVKTAVDELGAQVAAKGRMSATYARRGALIGAKIADAERMGAKDCSPGELTSAKNELERARQDAAGIRSGVKETDSSFDKAEQAADALLANRQFASRNGIKCFPE